MTTLKNLGNSPAQLRQPQFAQKKPGIEPGFLFNGEPRYTTRSNIIFLVSAIAFAGFKPLGQVLVQFMMVWQR